MHLFTELPVVDWAFDFRYAPELGGWFVDGVCALGSERTYVLCNLEGEPIDWDEPWHREYLRKRAVEAQRVDGFHL